MLQELKKTYQGKKVFLTGHTGFKGAWLLKILTLIGAQVKGYALAPENEFDLYHLLNGNEICESVIADIRNKDKLFEAITSFEPDFVFHLAAQPLVRLSYTIPIDTFEVNAIGSAILLEGVKKLNKLCCVVMVTTDKVYHNNEWLYPYRENDQLGGYDPYSASKACAELVIDSFRNSFFNLKSFDFHRKAIGVGRAGNVIGGGDWSKDRLIPDIVRSLAAGKPVEIRNPDAVRPWQHVLEPLLGYLLLGIKLTEEPQKYSCAFNFGPYYSDALPVKTMVELAINNWGTGSYFVQQSLTQLHEAGLLKLDISKALTEIGWKPKFNASAALNYTIDWYINYFNKNPNISDFTENQIRKFLV